MKKSSESTKKKPTKTKPKKKSVDKKNSRWGRGYAKRDY